MSEWISVEDRLPLHGESVLTIGVIDGGGFGYPIVAAIHPDGKFISGYCFSGSRHIYMAVETFPTHWMPLPSHPES